MVALRASPFPVVTSWYWVQKLEPEARSVGQGWCHTAPMESEEKVGVRGGQG